MDAKELFNRLTRLLTAAVSYGRELYGILCHPEADFKVGATVALEGDTVLVHIAGDSWHLAVYDGRVHGEFFRASRPKDEAPDWAWGIISGVVKGFQKELEAAAPPPPPPDEPPDTSNLEEVRQYIARRLKPGMRLAEVEGGLVLEWGEDRWELRHDEAGRLVAYYSGEGDDYVPFPFPKVY